MALIKCIECNKEISSFAETCPYCGCPASYQKQHGQDGEDLNSIILQNDAKLKDQEKWNSILDLVKQKRGQEALDEAKKITNRNTTAFNIVMKMMDTKEVPTEFIIRELPDQLLDPIKKEVPKSTAPPTTRPCKACNKTISVKAEKCPHCGEPTGVRVCPRCGSTDVVILDAVSKAVSMALFGVFSVNTVRSKYECWTCHFKF